MCLSSDRVSMAMDESSRTTLECALRCGCCAGKTAKFKSAVIRSTIFLVVTSPIPQFGEQGVIKIYFRYYYYYYHSHSHSDDRYRYRYR